MEKKISVDYAEATYQMDFDIFSATPHTSKPSESRGLKKLLGSIRIPKSKYKHIWKRIRMKLRFKSTIMNFMKSQQFLKSTSHTLLNNDRIVRKIVKKKHPTEAFTNIEHIESCMIHPQNFFKSIWNFIISILLLYTATIMPLSMAFFESDSADVWFDIDLVLDCLFFFDIVITFNSAYYDNCGVLISNRRQIMYKYLKSWFLFDILSCIPFNLISGAEGHNFNSLIRLARLPRLAKLLRLSRLLKVLKSSSQSGFMHKLEDLLDIKTSFMRLFQSFMTAIILVHLMACLWFYSAKFQDFEVNTWVVRFGFIDMSVGSLYLRSLYFIMTTLATVGYGDIYPCNDIERSLVIAWIIIVMFFMTFNISSMSNMISNIDTKESILQFKTSLIEDFCKENKLSKELRIRLKDALKYSTENNGGSLYNKQELILQLPKKLRFEVALTMHKGFAREISFFQKYNSTFVSNIIPLLISQRFRKGDIVYKEKDHPDEVYFIVSGRVGYMFFDKFIVFQQVFKGDHFGFFEIFLSAHRIFSTKATMNTEILTLRKNILLDILKQFPNVEQEIKEMIELEKLKTLRNIIEVKVLLELKRSGKIRDMNFNDIHDYINFRFMEYQKVWRELEPREIGVADLVLTCGTLQDKIIGLNGMYDKTKEEILNLSARIGVKEPN